MIFKRDVLFELFKTQDTLNKETCGDNWRSGICKSTGKKTVYDLAAIVETIEIIDSFDWAHWKSRENDLNNAAIEVIDVLHFIISLILMKNNLNNTSVDNIKNILDGLDEDIVIGNIELSIDNLKTLSEDLILCIIRLSRESNKLMIKNYSEELIKTFLKIMSLCKLDQLKLQRVYLGKNALNYLRLRNGYRTGEYIKIWDGVEDNVYLEKIILDLQCKDILTFINIYNALEEKYITLQ